MRGRWNEAGDAEFEDALGALCREVLPKVARELGKTDEQIEVMMARVETELAGRVDPTVVRENCSFCGRERSRSDDNHGPDCMFWEIDALARSWGLPGAG